MTPADTAAARALAADAAEARALIRIAGQFRGQLADALVAALAAELHLASSEPDNYACVASENLINNVKACALRESGSTPSS